MSHSPLPWKLYGDLNVRDAKGDHVASCGFNSTYQDAVKIGGENADLIVTACNAHDIVVKKVIPALIRGTHGSGSDPVGEIEYALKWLKTTGLLVTLIACLSGSAYASQVMYGTASWYSSADACGPKTNNLPGCPTASGDSIYDLEAGNKFFVALNEMPLKSKVKITCAETNREIIAYVMDRGGFKKYGRIADLSKQAFKRLAGSNSNGIINVKIERI